MTAPEWVQDTINNHQITRGYRDMIVRCVGCEWSEPFGEGVASDVIHRGHLADAVWEEVVRRANFHYDVSEFLTDHTDYDEKEDD